ncbi:PIG-L family deacetylase [Peptostreptococcaceae bacterium OttesenSCG-928-C18]|nr:PIG-L family deacetylase [Peptostreptococcaceae bacterium OttesenSCG-928-C18]
MGIKDILAKVLYYPIKFKNIGEIKKIYREHQINNPNLQELDLNKDFKNILVLAPHVDDETIGMGGILTKNISNNSTVDLLYMTDSGGSLGNENKDTAKERQIESAVLKERLHLNELTILDVKNNNVNEFNEYAINELTRILKTKDYNNIFIVSLFDAHIEHRWCNFILSTVLKDLEFRGNIYLYEVSNILPFSMVNAYKEINLEEKNILYDIFDSQKHTMDFDIFSQLNKYKGLSIGINNPVEFFCRLNKAEYLKLNTIIKNNNIEEKLIYRIGNHRSFYKVSNNEKKLQEFYDNILNK